MVAHDEWQCMHYDDGCRCVCKNCQSVSGKPVTAPVEPVQVLCGPDGQWSITGLSEEDLWALSGGLGSVQIHAYSTDDVDVERRLEKIIYDALPD